MSNSRVCVDGCGRLAQRPIHSTGRQPIRCLICQERHERERATIKQAARREAKKRKSDANQ